MPTSGSRTRTESRNSKKTKSSAVVNDGGNRRNNSKHGGDQKETKHSSVSNWEKRFCFQVGGLPWKRVTEAKKYSNLYGDVMAWNDSAGKAFDEAKARFWAEINGGRSKTRLPDPNMYIEEDIDWESKIDSEFLSGMKSAIDEEDTETEEGELEKVIQVQLEDIVATGWSMESFDNRTLTGIVVGD